MASVELRAARVPVWREKDFERYTQSKTKRRTSPFLFAITFSRAKKNDDSLSFAVQP